MHVAAAPPLRGAAMEARARVERGLLSPRMCWARCAGPRRSETGGPGHRQYGRRLAGFRPSCPQPFERVEVPVDVAVHQPSEAAYFPAAGAPQYDNDVLQLEQIHHSTTLGYIYGGIFAPVPLGWPYENRVLDSAFLLRSRPRNLSEMSPACATGRPARRGIKRRPCHAITPCPRRSAARTAVPTTCDSPDTAPGSS